MFYSGQSSVGDLCVPNPFKRMELGKEKPRVEVSSVLSIEDWEGRGAVQISHLAGGGGEGGALDQDGS